MRVEMLFVRKLPLGGAGVRGGKDANIKKALFSERLKFYPR